MSLSSDDIILKLDTMFISRFGKRFAELNKNVYIAAANDKGNFEVPVVILGKGGGTLIRGAPDVVKLEPPAQVSLQYRNMKPETLLYRLTVPFEECKIAVNKPEYFNYLFDDIVGKALNNYKATLGDENKVRFGEHYISFFRPGENNKVFRQAEDTNFELRLYSKLASNEEAYD